MFGMVDCVKSESLVLVRNDIVLDLSVLFVDVVLDLVTVLVLDVFRWETPVECSVEKCLTALEVFRAHQRRLQVVHTCQQLLHLLHVRRLWWRLTELFAFVTVAFFLHVLQ